MQGGGAERVAAVLCNHWVEQEHEVILMPTFSERGVCLYSLDERVQLDYLADRVDSQTHSAWNKLRRLWSLRQAIRKTAPDVIVSFLPHVNVAAVLSAWGLGIPVVVSERTYPPAVPLGRTFELMRRLAYPMASSVTVQSQQALAWLRDCCPNARGQVIPNPVVYPLPQGEPVLQPASVLGKKQRAVLSVGRLEEEKGFDQLLTAFGMLAQRYPNWDLIILGEGSERERLEQQRGSLGLNRRVHLPGRAGNPGDWYVRADFYVMSSRFEGFPNTLLEAMAYGLPAASFKCETGPADIIREGIDGYLVPPTEGVAGLIRAMEALMGNDETRQRMGRTAVAVRERFSLERIMTAWNEVLGL